MAKDGITDFVYGVVDTPDKLQHPLIRRLHDDWLAAAPADGLPGMASLIRCGSATCSACWW
jgi:hypothetical protein